MTETLDGSELLTGPQAGGVLEAAVTNAGGELVEWTLDHVDHRPSRSTKAMFRTKVRWVELDGPEAEPRDELFGVSAHIGEQEKNVLAPEQSLVMTDGDMNVRVWRYPHDPWLPMLPQVCYPDVLHETLAQLGVPTGYAEGTPVPVEVVSYRPGRRAVLKAALADRNVFLKVFQPHTTSSVVNLHHTLLDAGVPVPAVLGATDGLVVLAELPGTVLAKAVIDDGAQACHAADLVAMLDRLPASLMNQPVRPPWTDSAEFYAGVVASSLPSLKDRLDVLVYRIELGLADVERRIGLEPTEVVHGDFYEAQVFVDHSRVVGVLDIDGVGPGRRADDLACLCAHLSVLGDYANQGRLTLDIHERVAEAIRTWYPVFAGRVDPQELALRAAGVVLSLATGPHRQQENDWERATEAMVRVAETWVQVAEYGPHYVGPMPGGLISGSDATSPRDAAQVHEEQQGPEMADTGEAVSEFEPPQATERSPIVVPSIPSADTSFAHGAAHFEQDPTIPLPPIPELSDHQMEIALDGANEHSHEHFGRAGISMSPPTPVYAPGMRRHPRVRPARHTMMKSMAAAQPSDPRPRNTHRADTAEPAPEDAPSPSHDPEEGVR
ncbi:phosphotransferase [Dermabacter vaginalis]|uniref:Phosphotransferase n=1 Tax=Dermabacter vaginalis TaxID=1630135 RepID=A0ABX6A5M5_9MICO|nr:phosphotransferase [Dermabacter vaginalis]QEU12497.1 phosphotransferase [Dermabacter vaginalis]